MQDSALKLEDIISKTSDLPTLPVAAFRVIREAENSECTASRMASIIAQDQSLTARILRLANSAYYGLSRQVTELQEAVVVLGMRSVRNLAMVAATYPWLSRPLAGYQLGPKELWLHSYGVAIGTQLIARRLKLRNEDSAFTVGLVHDLGKVALSVWLENRTAQVLSAVTGAGLTYDAAERQVLGYDHTEVGHAMADRWNLPKIMVDAIRYHHAPDESTSDNPLVDCVHLGDYLTMTVGLGLGADGLQYAFSHDSLTRLGIAESDLDELAADFLLAWSDAEKVMEALEAA